MANEEASLLGIFAGITGNGSHDEPTIRMPEVGFSEAVAAKIASSEELQKEPPKEQSFDDEFPTSTLEDFFSSCPDCCYYNSDGQQHSDYCLNLFVQNPMNETSSLDNRRQHSGDCLNLFVQSPMSETSLLDNRRQHSRGLEEFLRQSTETLSSHTSTDQSPSTATAIPTASTTPTTILGDGSEDTAGESTDEPDIDTPSAQPPHLPHAADNQSQPVTPSEEHISNDGSPPDEPRDCSQICPICEKDLTPYRYDAFTRHIREHEPGKYPCLNQGCKKSIVAFKRADKLKDHREKCKFKPQLRDTESTS